MQSIFIVYNIACIQFDTDSRVFLILQIDRRGKYWLRYDTLGLETTVVPRFTNFRTYELFF